MAYLKITIQGDPGLFEILTAELLSLGFDSFLETTDALEAYIEADIYQPWELKAMLSGFQILDYEVETLEDRNWNEEWEKNFQPITIADQVYVRASFHEPDPRYLHEIIVNPKMSFGTGHHDTTSLMISEQLKMEFQGKKVLDVGTGTGILAILASKLGAESVDATDIDSWSIANCVDNFEQNGMIKIRIHQGTIDELVFDHEFDIILANINKNILLGEIKYYAHLLQPGGTLLISGFYEDDNEDLINEAIKHDLQLIKNQTSQHWSCLVFHLKHI